jgi:hypothetical protein
VSSTREEVRVNGSLALAPQAYEPPALLWPGETAEVRPYLVFLIVGLTFAAALAWASYCMAIGGSPSISLGWTGFKIACYR